MRRAMALLHLYEGHSVSATARLVCAARSTVQSWRDLYLEYGEQGLIPASRGRQCWTVTDDVVRKIN
ncbi:MAG: helix-turn-helix domain-containing protein, partial [Pseudomonadota bacterium]